jgi:hypothetical protein
MSENPIIPYERRHIYRCNAGGEIREMWISVTDRCPDHGSDMTLICIADPENPPRVQSYRCEVCTDHRELILAPLGSVQHCSNCGVELTLCTKDKPCCKDSDGRS